MDYFFKVKRKGKKRRIKNSKESGLLVGVSTTYEEEIEIPVVIGRRYKDKY